MKKNDMLLNIPIKSLCVLPHKSLHEVVVTIQNGEKQIALVVDEQQHLLGTITDYDLRKAILGGIKMDVAASVIMQKSFTSVKCGMSASEIFDIMRIKSLRHMPVVDEHGTVVDLAHLFDIVKQKSVDISAVVMAGGLGRRLRPLTENVPKPMLPIGNRPLLEIILQQLRLAGFQQVHVSTYHKEEVITKHFGDGSKYGVDINYLTEKQPLGTAGALGQLGALSSDEPILVINGDILTGLDFQTMLDYHREHKADITVAVRKYEFLVPYGVVECEGSNICKLKEKPKYNFFVNAGVYLIESSARSYIPKDQYFNMTDLIQALIDSGLSVISFPIIEYWLDIGKQTDYLQAQEDIKSGKFKC
jgi:dTDP-glucose pyrophosphorylase